ncbi:MAG TPA: redoxin domain-containing protein [Spirochaetota bacterium]|nr:redoxin domain-containing protein [Spirochaetota bacterium]HPV39712.1 redoxin domain-containing protein [Spirochaetota bacterium]
MAQLRHEYQHFVKLDTEIIVVGPEKAEAFRDYWTKEDLPFIGLPDPEHKVLKLYGQEVKLFKLGRLPAQMLINKSGNVRVVHYGHSMSDIPSNEEIILFTETTFMALHGEKPEAVAGQHMGSWSHYSCRYVILLSR